ncbi:MAG: hypothetical protein JRJ60_22565, partial [Deltaproteobacteria bacterium]|nr:hypothetical protein [Deltaproteobacteria bacterium]
KLWKAEFLWRSAAAVRTTTWGKSILATNLLPARTPDDYLKKSMDVTPTKNPLDFSPNPTDPGPTKDLLSGFIEAKEDMFPLTFTFIEYHPNPDNDGMYLNIKASRTWGVGGTAQSASESSAPVSLSISRTHAVHMNPVKLRMAFNTLVFLAREWHAKIKEGKVYGAEIGTGEGKLFAMGQERPDKEALKTLYVKRAKPLKAGVRLPMTTTRRMARQEYPDEESFFHADQGAELKLTLRYLALFGGFDLNFVYSDDTGFEVQYGRVWVATNAALGVGVPLPLPFMNLNVGLSASMTHCTAELLGLHTLTYILTVYNGFRKRLDGGPSLDAEEKGKQEDWKAFRHLHGGELNALFNWLAVPGSGAYEEVADDEKPALESDQVAKLTAAETDKKTTVIKTLEKTAKALLDLCRVTIDEHPAHLTPADEEEAQERVVHVVRAQIDAEPGPDVRAGAGDNQQQVVVRNAEQCGVRLLALYDPVADRRSAYYRAERNGQISIRPEKMIGPDEDTNKIFVLHPQSIYKISFFLENPKMIEKLKLELSKNDGTVVKEWEITHAECDLLRDPEGGADQTLPSGKKPWAFIEFYGTKDGDLALGTQAHVTDKTAMTIGKLSNPWRKPGGKLKATRDEPERKLESCHALDPNGKGEFYCLRMTLDSPAFKPVYPGAWTYFVVLDKPVRTLEKYLDAKGDFQTLDQERRWVLITKPEKGPDE